MFSHDAESVPKKCAKIVLMSLPSLLYSPLTYLSQGRRRLWCSLLRTHCNCHVSTIVIIVIIIIIFIGIAIVFVGAKIFGVVITFSIVTVISLSSQLNHHHHHHHQHCCRHRYLIFVVFVVVFVIRRIVTCHVNLLLLSWV